MTSKESLVNDLMVGVELNGSKLQRSMNSMVTVLRKCPKLLQYLKKMDFKEKKYSAYGLIAEIKSQKHILDNNVGEFLQLLKQFIEDFGFRGLSEIDASNDRFEENVEFLVSFIMNQQNVLSDVVLENKMTENDLKIKDPSDILEKQKKARESLLLDIREGSKNKWWNWISFGVLGYLQLLIAGRCCTLLQGIFCYREDPKHQVMRILYTFKKLFLSTALESLQYTGTKLQDLLFLSIPEIIYSVNHVKNADKMSQMWNAITKAKLEYQKQKKYSVVPRLLSGFGEQIELVSMMKEVDKYPPGTLIGVGVSSGVAEGVCKLVIDPLTTVVNKGEVLVAQQIDPAFTSLFHNAIAVVSTVGSSMSHGGVIAREMQIPAVVGVGDIRKLKDGVKVRVNGTIGTIEIL